MFQNQNAARVFYMKVSLKGTDCLQKSVILSDKESPIFDGCIFDVRERSSALCTAVTRETTVTTAPKVPPAGRG